jgi:putative aldouronate transport system permease protein
MKKEQTQTLSAPISIKQPSLLKRMAKYKIFYLLMIPGIFYLIIFQYLPMAGLGVSFFKYDIHGLGGFIGLQNFYEMFASHKFYSVFFNTLFLSLLNISIQMIIVIVISLLLNEIKNMFFKRSVQTVIYLPHFLSWPVVAAIFVLIFSPQNGSVNELIKYFGGKSIYFLGNEETWRPSYLFISFWKETGWATVVFLAALSSIDPQLYEAAEMDGAGKLRQAWHITLPHLRTVIAIVLIMNLSKMFNIFQSVFLLYNPMVYGVSDVIETYVYRRGFVDFNADYSYATAVGLFKSVIALILVLITNKIANKIHGDKII